MNENLEETMRIRKAIAPMIETMVKTIIADMPHPEVHMVEPKEPVVNVNVTTGPLEDSVKEEIRKMTTVVVAEFQKSISNLPKTTLSLPKKQEIMGKVSLDNVDTLEAVLKKHSDEIVDKLQKDNLENISDLVKTLILSQKKLNDDNKKEPLEVKVMNQMISEGGGGSKNTDERVWLREEFTYVTVSGRQVVSSIEKWDSTAKLTIRLDYDSNAKVVAKSRSLEPYVTFGE